MKLTFQGHRVKIRFALTRQTRWYVPMLLLYLHIKIKQLLELKISLKNVLFISVTYGDQYLFISVTYGVNLEPLTLGEI